MSNLTLRMAIALASRAAPALAARWAERLFFTPRGRRSSTRASAFLDAGRRLDLRVDGRRLATWSWGEGPAVLLVHGWAGLGGQLAAFGQALVERGQRVVTFDAPGHGASEGRLSSIVHFARAIHAVAQELGAPQAVIAHSLGAAATARALSEGLAVERAVFIGPTGGPRDWARRFAEHLGFPPAVMARMRERSERWLGASWDDFDMPALARRQTAGLLVIHDRDDAEVPWSDGAAIAAAWPQARLVTTAGLGHGRILRDLRVVEQAVAFVRGEPVLAGGGVALCASHGCGRLPVSGGLCEGCAIEASLYFRESRWPSLAMPA